MIEQYPILRESLTAKSKQKITDKSTAHLKETSAPSPEQRTDRITGPWEQSNLTPLPQRQGSRVSGNKGRGRQIPANPSTIPPIPAGANKGGGLVLLLFIPLLPFSRSPLSNLVSDSDDDRPLRSSSPLPPPPLPPSSRGSTASDAGKAPAAGRRNITVEAEIHTTPKHSKSLISINNKPDRLSLSPIPRWCPRRTAIPTRPPARTVAAATNTKNSGG